ncbi:MAG: hypothetical protein KIT62_04275 [Cyclobacteriaceae bacterium]|nr:hypothetical protein [Cyclobacteriaceae bacterium]
MGVVKLLVNLFQFNRTNWKAVSLCVLAAAVFWLFNAFNKNYATEIRFPLQVAYNESRFIPIKDLPNELKLNVSGNGWDLFRKSIGISLQALTLTIERPLEVKKIPGSTLAPLLAAQLNGLTINHVVSDTLRVQFDERDTHMFRLAPDLTEVWYREGFGRISPVVVLPDSARLIGPRSVLHRIPDVIRVKVPRLRLDENYRGEVPIVLPDSLQLNITPTHVIVSFEVGAMETFSLNMPVEVINLPKSVRIFSIDSARVEFRVARTHRERIEAELRQRLARIDLKDKPSGTHRLLPAINGVPEGAELVTIDSVEVSF